MATGAAPLRWDTPERSVGCIGPCVFFLLPNPDALIACLGPCQSAERPVRYPPILSRDHMRARHEAACRPINSDNS
jgi:hypothetical protein